MDGQVFVAIDFETADYESDSACSVALVRVEGRRIVTREHRLIRPPRRDFVFTYLHGIAWKDVKDAPTFRDAWLELRGLLDGASFLAAHNARFDRKVLTTCCKAARITPTKVPFLCTVALARRELGIYPTNLPSVCRRLGIRLHHHQAISDAEACARIVLAASRPPRSSTNRPMAEPK